MHPGALRALEFDRIARVVAGLAVTPGGRQHLEALRPSNDPAEVAAAQKATTEGVRFLATHPGFPLRAPEELDRTLDALTVEGRPLEPVRLLGLAEYLESVEQSRGTVLRLPDSFPRLRRLVERVASFKGEIASVRRAIEPSGEVADHASPALGSIRERLRRLRAKLRTTLDGFVKGRDTSKYLQEQVVTDRNGRYVLIVRAEHRASIPGIVHGGSASGASLYVEPLQTVEINNDIVALEEEESEEVHRILLALTDAFRGRPEELEATVEVATALDAIQARARFSRLVGGVEPALSADGTLELKAARHPLLMHRVRERLDVRRTGPEDETPADPSDRAAGPPRQDPVPVDIILLPPHRVLVITGPNTGGKTVAIKTAGLLAAMTQAGLHVPVDAGSSLPVFQSLFADIGDEQSIASSLSTFSAHITNVVSMDRALVLPALILLDEVGAGTDPAEGGALGTAIIDHFRRRGAHLIATTHYDSLKSYASTTDGVVGAAFGFEPETYAPTYRLVYGSPGRSLAIEIAARLGVPPAVVAAARANLGEREQQLAEHLARVDNDLRRLEQERRTLTRDRMAVADAERKLQAREQVVREREEASRTRLSAKLDAQVRDARREIDAVLDALKRRVAEMGDKAAQRAAAAVINTGEAGAARADARAAIDRAIARAKEGTSTAGPAAIAAPAQSRTGELTRGASVIVGGLGVEGVVIDISGKHAEVDVRGKRLRALAADLQVVRGASSRETARVRVNLDLQPRQGSLSELNVIGSTVDEALDRVEKFLDEAVVTEQRVLRIVHGHGTGQLRRAVAGFLKEHPLVARVQTAPQDQGGGGATIVELKD